VEVNDLSVCTGDVCIGGKNAALHHVMRLCCDGMVATEALRWHGRDGGGILTNTPTKNFTRCRPPALLSTEASREALPLPLLLSPLTTASRAGAPASPAATELMVVVPIHRGGAWISASAESVTPCY
jgi:hypothetical protein